MLKQRLAGAVAVLVVAGIVFAGEEKKVELESLPAALQTAINAVAKGGTIVEIEEEASKGGTKYDVEVLKDGKKTEYEFSAQGKLLRTENDDQDDDDDEDEDGDDHEDADDQVERGALPTAVLAIFDAATEGATNVTYEAEKEHGAMVYEEKYFIAGVEHALEVSADGTMLEAEKGISTEELPKAVRDSVAKRFPKAQIKGAAEVTEITYKVTVVVDGKTREFDVTGAGGMKRHD